MAGGPNPACFKSLLEVLSRTEQWLEVRTNPFFSFFFFPIFKGNEKIVTLFSVTKIVSVFVEHLCKLLSISGFV